MSTGDFKVDRLLGEGAFGKVYLVTDSKTSEQYAMKVIDLKTSPPDEKELALKEAQLLQDFDHVNVLRATEAFEHQGALCIVTDFCANGDLAEYLEKRNGKKLPEDQLLNWFKQISSGVEYLHGKDIMHRDLKTPNVFFDDQWNAKLGDLGLAKVLEQPNAKAVTFCGSPYYMSPEIFSCKPYGKKSDIWAMAVIVYEMATLERPFEAMLMHQLVFKIVHGKLPDMPKGYKPELNTLLAKMMSKDPEQRPSAKGILADAVFQNVSPKSTPLSPNKVKGGAGLNESQRWGSVIQKAMVPDGGAVGGAGGIDIDALLGTLTQRRKNKDNDTAEATGVQTILASNFDDTMSLSKTVKKDVTLKAKKPGLPAPRKQAFVSPDSSTSSNASSDDNSGDPSRMVQLVVRTLTNIFPQGAPVVDPMSGKGQKESRELMLIRQIEQLQYYCIKVLNDDMVLMQKAYDMLGEERNETKLEANIKKCLGEEKWALCGVQLMYCKNFEYNLLKLQKEKREQAQGKGKK